LSRTGFQRLRLKEIGPAALYRDYHEALEKRGALGAAIAAGRKMLASWPAKNEPNCAVMAEEMIEALLEKKGDSYCCDRNVAETIRNRELGHTRKAALAAKCDEQRARIRVKIR
jgi:hypothetical protein